MRPAAAEGSTTDGTRQLILRAPGSHRSRVSSAVRVRWSARNEPLAPGGAPPRRLGAPARGLREDADRLDRVRGHRRGRAGAGRDGRSGGATGVAARPPAQRIQCGRGVGRGDLAEMRPGCRPAFQDRPDGSEVDVNAGVRPGRVRASPPGSTSSQARTSPAKPVHWVLADPPGRLTGTAARQRILRATGDDERPGNCLPATWRPCAAACAPTSTRSSRPPPSRRR